MKCSLQAWNALECIFAASALPKFAPDLNWKVLHSSLDPLTGWMEGHFMVESKPPLLEKSGYKLTEYCVSSTASAAVSRMSGDWDNTEAGSVSASNVEGTAASMTAGQPKITASTAVSALAQTAMHQFSPELTTKILDLLCDESVSCWLCC